MNLPAKSLLLSGVLFISQSLSHAVVYDITSATGPFSLFSGSPNTTYFGWSNGTWDGNVDTNIPPAASTDDIINGNPSINPGALPGPLLFQGGSNDIISGSNNIYSGVLGINNADISLSIPTMGTPGTGFTTIVIQGKGLSGAAFGGSGALDSLAFGTINGVAPTHIYSANANGEGQWWAQWNIAGNAASYTVDITAYDMGVGVVSVTDMTVNTIWSADGFADVSAVPEPSTAAFLAIGSIGIMFLRRRRR